MSWKERFLEKLPSPKTCFRWAGLVLIPPIFVACAPGQSRNEESARIIEQSVKIMADSYRECVVSSPQEALSRIRGGVDPYQLRVAPEGSSAADRVRLIRQTNLRALQIIVRDFRPSLPSESVALQIARHYRAFAGGQAFLALEDGTLFGQELAESAKCDQTTADVLQAPIEIARLRSQ